MVALKNGIIQNKDGHPFDRSTGTWKNQNVAENPNVVQENVSNYDEKNTSTKNSDTTTQNSNSTETQQTDAENKNPSATNEKPTAETPKPTAETPKPTAETPKPIDDLFADLLNDLPPDETPKPTAETPKPHIISYNIDGKQVLIPFDDLPHFNELRRQLASGIPLDDDLIRKIKPILTETHLQDGTKIFNDETKLSQLDDIMKHYRGKQISSLDDFLRFVLHTIR